MESPPPDLREIHALGPDTAEWLAGMREVRAFRPLQLRVAGCTDAGRGYEFVRHEPNFSQVLACTGGEGEVWVDGGWRRCGEGEAYLTAPRAFCAYRARPGKRWQVCWVLYEAAFALPTLAAGAPPRLAAADARGLRLAIEGLCHEVAVTADAAALEAWTGLVHRTVLRTLAPAGGDARLTRLWLAVRADLGGKWDLARLARTAGLSGESLRRLCQRQIGRPPLAHVTHLRMHLAADLLASSRETIESIAARAGYADPFTFSNAFKREMGLPPSRYRARFSP